MISFFPPADQSLYVQSPAITLPPTPPSKTDYVEWNTPGLVELEDSMGSDLSIVKRLRKSFDKNESVEWQYIERCAYCFEKKAEAEGPTCGRQGIDGADLEHYWIQLEPHLSPYHRGLVDRAVQYGHQIFGGVMFTFHVKCTIKVARDWFRHPHDFNEVSTRFSVMKGEFYVPRGDDMRAQDGKIQNNAFSPLLEPFSTVASDIIAEGSRDAFERYETMLRMGVAREVASYILPLNTMTSFYDTVSLRKLWCFLHARGSGSGAIREMQFLADKCEELATEVCPEAFDIWNKYGRRAL